MADTEMFDGRLIFNPEAFGKYMEQIPRAKTNKFIQSGILTNDSSLGEYFNAQSGSFFQKIPMYGRGSGATEANYDGETTLNAFGKIDSYQYGCICYGRTFGVEEKDFSADIVPGTDFTGKLRGYIIENRDDALAGRVYSMMNTLFGARTAGTQEAKFVANHTTYVQGEIEATTVNNAVQKACKSNKKLFTAMGVHSEISTELENTNLLQFVKQVDADGMVRDSTMAQLNGKNLVTDDDMPKIALDDSDGDPAYYVKCASTDTDALHIVASGASTGEINLASVVLVPGSPSATTGDYVCPGSSLGLGDYFYISYLFGTGALRYKDVGAKVPFEPYRLPLLNGGTDQLIVRYREVMHPYGFSYEGTPSTNSPTDTELFTTASWSLVNNAKTGANRKTFDESLIPLARVISYVG